jgi:hypothetical protein
LTSSSLPFDVEAAVEFKDEPEALTIFATPATELER